MNLFNQLYIMNIVMNTTNILYKLQLGSALKYSRFFHFLQFSR